MRCCIPCGVVVGFGIFCSVVSYVRRIHSCKRCALVEHVLSRVITPSWDACPRGRDCVWTSQTNWRLTEGCLQSCSVLLRSSSLCFSSAKTPWSRRERSLVSQHSMLPIAEPVPYGADASPWLVGIGGIEGSPRASIGPELREPSIFGWFNGGAVTAKQQLQLSPCTLPPWSTFRGLAVWCHL